MPKFMIIKEENGSIIYSITSQKCLKKNILDDLLCLELNAPRIL